MVDATRAAGTMFFKQATKNKDTIAPGLENVAFPKKPARQAAEPNRRIQLPTASV